MVEQERCRDTGHFVTKMRKARHQLITNKVNHTRTRLVPWTTWRSVQGFLFFHVLCCHRANNQVPSLIYFLFLLTLIRFEEFNISKHSMDSLRRNQVGLKGPPLSPPTNSCKPIHQLTLFLSPQVCFIRPTMTKVTPPGMSPDFQADSIARAVYTIIKQLFTHFQMNILHPQCHNSAIPCM